MMMCPSNPVDRAFKRHYKDSLLMMVLVFGILTTSVNAFTSRTKTFHFKPKLGTTNPSVLHPLSKAVGGYDRMDVSLSATLFDSQSTYNPSRLQTVVSYVAARTPGVALAAFIGQLSIAMSKTSFGSQISPLLWATTLGMCFGNLLYKPEAKPTFSEGIKFSKSRLLRLGIILYGFKITMQQIGGIGIGGVMTDAFMVVTTLFLGTFFGTKVCKLDEATSTLIASGSAICGCSAVLATQPVVGGESHQVSAAVATVVVGGTLSMFLYPLFFKYVPFLASNPKIMGIFAGSTIHEIAGAVAAGNAMGPAVATTTVVTKLCRVLFLAPALTGLSWIRSMRECKLGQESKEKCKISLPWFAFAFLGISALNSAITFNAGLVKTASKMSANALICAMAALGIDSDFKEIKKLGVKPIFLASALWGWLVVGGFTAARFFN